ncbi:MAG: alpha/beta hydrolase [Chloroflexia bacterium]|nr:alpha/beta hydrolase [Chloroflexia bacterium]
MRSTNCRHGASGARPDCLAPDHREKGSDAAATAIETRDTPLVRLASRWTEVAGYRMHTPLATGAAPIGAPPVVLVHGLGVSSRYMVPTARRLARFFPTYAPDLPGFGRSGRPKPALRLPELADALVAWLDAVGLERPVLIANSLGCQIVVDLAVRHPARLSGAVLVGPTGDPEAAGLLGMFARLLADVPREPLSALPLQAFDYLTAGPLRDFRTAREMVCDPFVAKLPRVPHPVLVVRGERDPIAPQRWAAEIVALLPAGELAVVPGAAHIVNYSHPAALVALVRGFVARHLPPGER